jgi:hypothetical protein
MSNLALQILVTEAGHALYEGPDKDAEQYTQHMEERLRQITGAEAKVRGFDPTVGASSAGIVATLLLGVAAAATWDGVKAAAAAIRRCAQELASDKSSTTAYGQEAIRLLVLDDVLARFADGQIVDATIIRHSKPQHEPRPDLNAFYSLYTVVVILQHGYEREVLQYLVTAHGIVLFEGMAPIRSANDEEWLSGSVLGRRLRAST